MTQGYESHPIALMFPMMTDAELAELADDIKTNGPAEPIALYEGKILDGRNRYQACRLAGVEPRITELEKLESPISYVVSKNLQRRHLTESQRTTIAAEIKPLLKQKMTDRQQRGGKLADRARPKTEQVQETFPEPIAPSNSNDLHGQSRDIVGNLL